MELDPFHKGRSTTINAAHPLLITTTIDPRIDSEVIGLRGIELIVGSGQKGFFEVRCIKGNKEHIIIGLATCEVDFFCRLGSAYEGIGWLSRGKVLLGHGMGATDLDVHNGRRLAPRFTTGDVLGLMVDCSEAPKLLFFVNGDQVGDMVFSQEVLGKVLFPAFTLRGDSEIEISLNPDLPAYVGV